MITRKLIDDAAFAALTGRRLKSFSGGRYFYLYCDTPERYRQFESTGLYGSGKISTLKHFELGQYLDLETVEHEGLCHELEEDRASAEAWYASDKTEYFHRQFLFLLKHQDRILESPSFYWSYPEAAHAGTSFSGGKELPIGPLLEAWKAGDLVIECPHCSEQTLHVFQLGSGLSGGSAGGFCGSCGRAGCIHGFIKEHIFAILERLRNSTVEKRRGIRFNALIEKLNA